MYRLMLLQTEVETEVPAYEYRNKIVYIPRCRHHSAGSEIKYLQEIHNLLKIKGTSIVGSFRVTVR